MNVLLDTNVSEPMRERPDAVVMAELEQGGYSLQPVSLLIHELSFGIQHLADGRRKERFRSYLQNLWRLMGCSCLDASAGSASFKLATGPWLSFALDLPY